jgi:arylsulfatase A-like enzyme
MEAKYWDKFTPAQRDHLKAKIKDFDDLLGHGTKNCAIMKCVAAYLFAQYWPDDTRRVRGPKTSAEVMETARARLLAVIKSLYDKSYEVHLSHAMFWAHAGNYALRSGKWKLVLKAGGQWELYDIETDRTELHDLAAPVPDNVNALAAKWEAWAERAQLTRN